MFAFIIRRIIQAVFVMLVISLVGFSIQHSIGDPVRDLVGERVTPAEREVIREQLDHLFIYCLVMFQAIVFCDP